jgi:hypothetical protein
MKDEGNQMLRLFANYKITFCCEVLVPWHLVELLRLEIQQSRVTNILLFILKHCSQSAIPFL